MKEAIEILLKGKKLLFLHVSDCEDVITELQKRGHQCRVIPIPMIISPVDKGGWITTNVYALEVLLEGGE